MKFNLFFILLFTVSGNSFAGSSTLSIQILASEEPNISTIESSTGFKELYTEDSGLGFIRVKLGSYHSRGEAERALNEVKEKGFPDAFITSYNKGEKSHTHSVIKTFSPEDSPAWPRLTEEQKQNIVYVDGVLHVHENGNFIPLSSL